jgi:8-oxo-dGTP pyrophosphatase MutT (NUDIX family)
MTLKYKTSYGIALCRFNKEKNYQSEILMIKKRYTYYYFNFVFGLYVIQNIKQLRILFDNMTFSEKVDILSMRFNIMWYRLWLCNPEKTFYTDKLIKNEAKNTNQPQKNIKYYHKKKNKFESTFLKDGGSQLRKLITNSSNSTTPWEIPKGGKNENEFDLNCAVREFEEETDISFNNYTMLWSTPPIKVSHRVDTTVYISIYYVAYLNNDSKWSPKINFNLQNQLNEVEEVRWVSLDEIKFLNLNEIPKKRLINNYKKIIYKFKKNIKSTYYNTIKNKY